MDNYLAFLKNKIFKTEEYDQFNLLINKICQLVVENSCQISILERSYIYGGRSLFANLIPIEKLDKIIDYRPESAELRANYQGHWIDESGFDFSMSTESIVDLTSAYSFSFDNISSEMLLIPNVLHHCRDFNQLLHDLNIKMPCLKKVFIFDSYLRENHQNPDDFCRYTPAALENVFQKHGFVKEDVSETGNIFDALLYLISQATWQLKNKDELRQINILIDQLIPLLREVRSDASYKDLGRPHAFMSTAYTLTFSKL